MTSAAAMLALLALGAGRANAQENTSFASGLTALTVGQRVTITDNSGNTTKGSVARLSGGELTVGDRTFREADVRRILKDGDSRLNGTLIGGAIGLGIGGLASAGVGEYGESGVFAPALVLGVGLGTGLGFLVDHFKGGPTAVFESTKPRARLIPMIGTRRGVLLSLTY